MFNLDIEKFKSIDMPRFASKQKGVNPIFSEAVKQCRKHVDFEMINAIGNSAMYAFDDENLVHYVHCDSNLGYDYTDENERNDYAIATALLELLHEFKHVIDGDKIYMNPPRTPSQEIIDTAIEMAIFPTHPPNITQAITVTAKQCLQAKSLPTCSRTIIR